METRNRSAKVADYLQHLAALRSVSSRNGQSRPTGRCAHCALRHGHKLAMERRDRPLAFLSTTIRRKIRRPSATKWTRRNRSLKRASSARRKGSTATSTHCSLLQVCLSAHETSVRAAYVKNARTIPCGAAKSSQFRNTCPADGMATDPSIAKDWGPASTVSSSSVSVTRQDVWKVSPCPRQ